MLLNSSRIFYTHALFFCLFACLLAQIIPDERDVEEFLGEDKFRASYIVAQENIELVTERPDFLVNHRHLGSLFRGFDFAAGTYRVPAKLQYCFAGPRKMPPRLATTNAGGDEVVAVRTSVTLESVVETTNTTSTSTCTSTDNALLTGAMSQVHETVDEILLELLAYMRESLSQTRLNDALFRAAQIESELTDLLAPVNPDTSDVPLSTGTVSSADHAHATTAPTSLNMKDLLVLLKFAKSQDHAMYVESMLWQVWVAHTSPDINKLMRLSIAHAKRGNIETAITIMTQVIELDPTFAEAYNKRASFYHVNKQYDECIENAQASLDIFPDHVGALSGLSLCYEQRGKLA